VSDDDMREIGDILGITAAEVLSTASFYTMYKREPVGEYLISVCRGISCMWLGSEELFEHLCDRLGITAHQTTPDGKFTIEEMECAAACGGAPCLQVNYLYAENMTPSKADQIIDELAAGRQPSYVQRDLPVGAHPGSARP
jgi:NADH-quinone oxidoreductase subunit E